MDIKFGTAGVPFSAKDSSTEAGIIRVRELGMDAMEVEFVQGVRMKEEKAERTGKTAEREQIALSCHAPYFINLNSSEAEKVTASKSRIIQTARIGKILGATGIIFHPAFYGGETSDRVLAKVVDELQAVRRELDQENNDVILRPETTGKPSQFGDLAETIKIAQEIPGVLPCIDFSHLHARSNGEYNSYDEFCRILEQTAEGLGDRWVANAHFHISGIDYGPKGEKKHLVLLEADLRYKELMQALLSFGIKGTVICESPNLEEDALRLQEAYKELIGAPA
ncbi:TIM barrel protein [Dehalobacter sp. DCM]|uniref:TIM barrel protein n=1 Tax=Dehalobacter sp. DCM TaxID=2907827 RepID=UPI0030821489|nr:TIM barrel protein [Dehalobacter sp. DCM]